MTVKLFILLWTQTTEFTQNLLAQGKVENLIIPVKIMIEDFHNNDHIKEDNIAAAASNISQAAAIVIIRLSGPDTHTLLKKCLPKGVKAEHTI